MRRLENRAILLAGGAGGIGEATARRLASEGAKIVVGDIDADAARSIAASINDAGGRAVAHPFDISDDGAVKDFVEFGVRTFGVIDGLHANAAYLSIQHLDTNVLEIGLDVWDRILDVNLKGYVYCTRHVLPHLLERGGGAIVYTSSGAAFAGEPVRVAYAASKAGVNALMRHVASAWGKQGIRANAIAPGLVTSPTVLALPLEFREQCLRANRSTRLGDPSDIAAVVAMLMSEDGAWIQGQLVNVDGGQTLR